jgi:hypothetical protein
LLFLSQKGPILVIGDGHVLNHRGHGVSQAGQRECGQCVYFSAWRAGNEMNMVKSIERADRIAGIDARASAYSHTCHLAHVIATETKTPALEAAKHSLICITPHSDMNVTEQRQPQPLAQPTSALYCERPRDALAVNSMYCFAVSAGKINAAVKPGIVIGENLAADFTKRAGELAGYCGRIVRPPRGNGGTNLLCRKEDTARCRLLSLSLSAREKSSHEAARAIRKYEDVVGREGKTRRIVQTGTLNLAVNEATRESTGERAN